MAPKQKPTDDKQSVGEMSKDELLALITNALKPLNNSVKALQNEIAGLRTEVESLKEDIEKKDEEISDLYVRLDEREQYSRRNNLRIFGVTETEHENTDNLVVKVAKDIGVTLDGHNIDRSHRIGKPGPKPRPIIVKFIGYHARKEMFSAKKALKGTGITIREDLTKCRLEVLKRAVKEYSERNVWSSDGVIMVKINNLRPIRVKSERDLDSLLERHPPPHR